VGPRPPACRLPPASCLRQDDGYFVKLNQLMFTKSAALPEEKTR
jgi:hypothetical protein